MTRVLNAMDAEQAARIRAHISGKPVQLAAAKPEREPGMPKAMVSKFHRYDPRTDTHLIQLPIFFDRALYNVGRHDLIRLPNGMVISKREEAAKKAKKKVGDALANYLPSWLDDETERARLLHIAFVRLGMRKLDDDNVVAAFKAVRDRTCSFAVAGRKSFEKNYGRIIGKADDTLKQRGVTWTYAQKQCQANPRAFGIQIILHCAPRSSE